MRPRRKHQPAPLQDRRHTETLACSPLQLGVLEAMPLLHTAAAAMMVAEAPSAVVAVVVVVVSAAAAQPSQQSAQSIPPPDPQLADFVAAEQQLSARPQALKLKLVLVLAWVLQREELPQAWAPLQSLHAPALSLLALLLLGAEAVAECDRTVGSCATVTLWSLQPAVAAAGVGDADLATYAGC